MRIAVPSNDQQTLAQHVGRCQGFVIVEVTDGAVAGREWRPNTFTGHARGKHDHGHHHDHKGRHAGVLAALSDCQVLVSGHMGQPLHRDLVAAGIETYTTALREIDAVVEAILAGTLADQPERRCEPDHHHEH